MASSKTRRHKEMRSAVRDNIRSTTSMRTAKTGYIVSSILFCIFGIILLIRPDISISVLGTLIGVIMLLFGAVKVIGYCSKDLYRLAFQYDLGFGLLLAALGIIVLIKPGSIVTFLCVAIGVATLADGLLKVQIAGDSKRFGIRNWWLILIAAIFTGLVGLLLVFRPVETTAVIMRLLGIALIMDGILSLITVLSTVKIIKHQRVDVIEGEAREIE